AHRPRLVRLVYASHVYCLVVIARRPSSIADHFAVADTATTPIYTLSLHDALPISLRLLQGGRKPIKSSLLLPALYQNADQHKQRSEEHTSELQSRFDLVCRLLLEKKKHQSSHKTATSGKARSGLNVRLILTNHRGT